MAISEFPLSTEPIGSDEAGVFETLEYWILVQGVIQSQAQVDAIDIEETLGGRFTARFKLVNPVTFPQAGQVVEIVYRDETIFGGLLQTWTLDTDQAETAKVFSCEAVGWEILLERRQVTAEYVNTPAGTIIQNILDTILFTEGITRGTIEPGVTLRLAKADNIRVREFLRDVADGGGGRVYIDPYKVLHFRTATPSTAPQVLSNAEIEVASTNEDLDEYENRHTVNVTGTGGATVTVQREDLAEIAARQALEGSSGIYEVSDSIQHPTSNDVIQLERLGISYALLQLEAKGHLRRTFSAKVRQQLFRAGQLVPVDLPGYQLAGEWQIVRLRTHDEWPNLVFECEAMLTTGKLLYLDSLLRIVGAGRATIMLPVAQFANLDTFETPGTFSYIVVGSGNVEVELTCYGAGGGGGSGGERSIGTDFSGGPGGDGGKTVSFRTLPAGSILTVRVGAGGIGGVPVPLGSFGTGSGAGADGELSDVVFGGLITRGDGGRGAPGESAGAPGSGVGDHVFTSIGAAGGAPGFGPAQNGFDGSNGRVEIRY